MKKIGIIISTILGFTAIGGSFAAAIYDQSQWARVCDGTSITSTCSVDGKRYSKYIYHEAVKEQTKEVNHPAEPAKTHKVHHEAVYGTKQVITGCIRTNIRYKNGTCALSRCRDGMYSGSSGWGTCNYHGGVWYGGGPWYTYETQRYVITPAWDETVVDVPAKKAWTETVVVVPAREAYIEKEIAK